VLGEERGISGGTGNGRTWLVDPLCGTLNYAAGTPGVAVNVAMRRPEGVAVAAVADPLVSEVLWTDGGWPSRRRGTIDERVLPSSSSGLVDLNLDGPFPSAPAFRCVDLIAHPDFPARFRPRVLSSTLALAWVATGARAAYVTDGEVGDSVHFAAGIAICVAAGCVLTDLSGAPWTIRSSALVAAADQATSAALLELIGGV
jgi:myo-inositol-1(or 4)-monophosphatase